MQPFRHTWVEINLDAIYDNVSSFTRWMKPDKEVMVSVKADGYGHGAIPVAKEAIKAGASWLGVALLEEAIELRQAGIDIPILMLGYLAPEYMPVAQEHRISTTVTNLAHFRQVCAQLEANKHPLHFHLKLDTGMGRLGMTSTEELSQFLHVYREQKKQLGQTLIWEGVYTHLATADEADETYLEQQLSSMRRNLKLIHQHGIQIPYVHLSNSAGTIRQLNDPPNNLIRLGISMYGLAPSGYMHSKLPFPLKPALSLHSRLSFVKKARPGQGISYGKTYVTKGEEWIGTIPIGYADGWSRNLSNRAQVLIQGQRMDLVGRICMDQTMVKLHGRCDIGEKVTLIGKQGDEEITADELAQLLGTIPYEIVCMISSRVPRKYVRDDFESES